MDSVYAQENDNIENVLEAWALEFGMDSHKVKTFIFNADHDFGISQWISGEKIYNKMNEDCRNRITRYLSYCRLI